jgi:hypothetical protein
MRYSLNQDTFEKAKGMCCDFCANISVNENADQCKVVLGDEFFGYFHILKRSAAEDAVAVLHHSDAG